MMDASLTRIAALWRHRARARLLLLLLLLTHALFASNPPFGLTGWTTDDGLPQNIIRGIRQGQNGYLWVATLDGLARFDGVRFVVFDKSNSPGLHSNRMTSIHQAPNGDLWMATDGGGVSRLRDGVFTSYSTTEGLPHNLVYSVTGDESGRVWVVSLGAIWEWNENLKRFYAVSLDAPQRHYDEIRWSQGFWTTSEEDIYCFRAGNLSRFPLPAWLPGSKVRQLAIDPDGSIWLWTDDKKLAKIAAGSDIAQLVTVSGPDASYLHRDRSGQQWEIQVGEALTRSLAPAAGLSARKTAFTFLTEDREGNLWLGTDGDGLFQVRRQTVSSYATEPTLTTKAVYPVLEDSRGHIWAGGWHGGLARFDGRHFQRFHTAEGLPDAVITALGEDRKGQVWVAANEALRVWNGRRFVAPEYITAPARTAIQAIYQDTEGVLWLGTSRGLLRAKDGVQELLTTADGLATDDVRVIIPAKGGGMWLAGYGGLTLFRDRAAKVWSSELGSLASSLRSLYEDADGVLWIGSYDSGIGRLADGKFTQYTTNEGLFNNGAFQILEDRRGNFWMSCNRGIHRVRKSELNAFARGERSTVSSASYGKADGMRNAECNGGYWPSGVRTRDGRLWFPTQDGLAVVDPERVPLNAEAPPVTIESFTVEGWEVPVDKPVEVDPERKSFEITYTALSFVHPGQIRFRYKLEGLDRDWIEAGTRRTAYYSHVPPGAYQFQVIAGNSDGVWSDQAATIPVVIQAAFYQTWWFATAALLAGVALAASVWQYRIARIERSQALQQAFSRKLLASQESERKRIAAELHDSIGQRLVVVKNLALFFLREQGDMAKERFSSIDEIASEASLAIDETREISYNLRPFQLDRLGLTRAIESLVQTASNAAAIEIQTKIENIDDAFAEDLRINFYRIVQECLNNIVKHAGATEASVEVRVQQDEIRLRIRDNGEGFSPQKSSGTTRGGFGMIGMQERASLLGGTVDIQSASGKGTTVTVRFRRGNDHE